MIFSVNAAAQCRFAGVFSNQAFVMVRV